VAEMNIVKILQDNKIYFEDFITRSTYNSNAIEGSTLTYADTYAIIFNDESFKVTATSREIYEALNHKYALNYVLDNLTNPLSLQFIIEINQVINKNILTIDGFRQTNVVIRGSDYIPPAKEQVYNLMMYFIDNYNNANFDSIFMKVATMHVDFERIHPFEDGNGRTGRIIINYELLKNNLPPCVIPVEERSTYFELIRKQDTQAFSEYIKQKVLTEEKLIEKLGSVL
jgi:Fic family protein